MLSLCLSKDGDNSHSHDETKRRSLEVERRGADLVQLGTGLGPRIGRGTHRRSRCDSHSGRDVCLDRLGFVVCRVNRLLGDDELLVTAGGGRRGR